MTTAKIGDVTPLSKTEKEELGTGILIGVNREKNFYKIMEYNIGGDITNTVTIPLEYISALSCQFTSFFAEEVRRLQEDKFFI